MSLPAACTSSALLPCLYLVACPAGWQPLELGVAGQDRVPLAALSSNSLVQRLLEAWLAALPGACLQGTPVLVSATCSVRCSPQSHVCWVEARSLAMLLRDQAGVCAVRLQRCLFGPVWVWLGWAGPGLVPCRASGPPNRGQEAVKKMSGPWLRAEGRRLWQRLAESLKASPAVGQQDPRDPCASCPVAWLARGGGKHSG